MEGRHRIVKHPWNLAPVRCLDGAAKNNLVGKLSRRSWAPPLACMVKIINLFQIFYTQLLTDVVFDRARQEVSQMIWYIKVQGPLFP